MPLWRNGTVLAALALLSACAAQPVELVGYCWVNDPASQWVVTNDMAIRAEQHCKGNYRILERRDFPSGTGHEYRWTIECEASGG